MPTIPIYQLDSFTTELFKGNPAAVMVLPAFDDDARLLAIAAENNLSETAFLVRQDDGYRIRWFTPKVEVPLCGHATLAAAAVVMERLEPGRASVTFDSLSGALTVTRKGDAYSLDFPVRPTEPVALPPGLAEALGATPVAVLKDAGNFTAVFADEEVVRMLRPDLEAIARLPVGGVVVTAPGSAPYDCVSRYFAPAKGVPEDPVTGGAHCALAPYWGARLGKRTLLAYQASQRGGELRCTVNGARVELEGCCVFYLEGQVML